MTEFYKITHDGQGALSLPLPEDSGQSVSLHNTNELTELTATRSKSWLLVWMAGN